MTPLLIARRTGLSPGALHRELTALAQTGFLKRVDVGQQVHFQLNHRFPRLPQISPAFEALLGLPAAGGVADAPATYLVGSHAKRDEHTPLSRLKTDKKGLAAICRRHGVRKLSFFGSVTREDFRAQSDVDVLVEFKSNRSATLADLVELQGDLSRLFGGRNVDVATTAILQNPYRRAAIEKDLRTAYVAR